MKRITHFTELPFSHDLNSLFRTISKAPCRRPASTGSRTRVSLKYLSVKILFFVLLSTTCFAQIVVTNTAELTAAMNSAQSGQTVYLRAGTYRLTVVPANSGVTFQNYENEVATISGLEPVPGPWTVHSGQIYKTTVSLPNAANYQEIIGESNTSILANQIFKDGVMQFHARWPNVDKIEDYFDQTKFRQGSSGNINTTSLTDAALPSGLAGGWVMVNGWFLSETRQISSQSGATIYYPALSIQNAVEHFRKRFYVTNKLVLLDSEKEWHYENGVLYFWQTNAGLPSGVEYKKRNWGFDLRGKTNITIKGLKFIGCDPFVTSTTSSGIVCDNIRAKYMNHSFLIMYATGQYTKAAEQSGTKILCSGCIIKNSEFKYAGAVGVWLGQGARAENNLFEWMVYDGMWGSPVKNAVGNDQKILHNSFINSGRGGVELSFTGSQRIEIAYNYFSGHNRLSNDGGGIYSQANRNHSGTRIHHNWFTENKPTPVTQGIDVLGVYLDQGSGQGVTIDHNVHWNGAQHSSAGDFYTEKYPGNPSHNIYNNTFATPTPWSYVSWNWQNGLDVLRNNIFRSGISEESRQNNQFFVKQNTDPKFTMQGEGGLKYRLQDSSPARNAGTVISSITDGAVGVPDIGAYEFGGLDWVAGYVPVNVTPEPPDPEPPDTTGYKTMLIIGIEQ